MRIFSSKLLLNSGEADWTTAKQDTNLGARGWRSLAYGDDKFMAIAYNGYVSTSQYGTLWTPATQSLGSLSIGAGWVSIVHCSYPLYRNAQFVTISNNSRVGFSVDGTYWYTQNYSSYLGNHQWSAIACNNLVDFVVISPDGYVAKGEGAMYWDSPTQSSELGSRGWTGLTYGNNKYVAVSSDGYVSTSTEGETWTNAIKAINNINDIYSITFDGKKFTVITLSGYTSESTDRINWTPAIQNIRLGSNNWQAIAYGNNKYVALGVNGYISTKRV